LCAAIILGRIGGEWSGRGIARQQDFGNIFAKSFPGLDLVEISSAQIFSRFTVHEACGIAALAWRRHPVPEKQTTLPSV
jgi:hypothetical protein